MGLLAPDVRTMQIAPKLLAAAVLALAAILLARPADAYLDPGTGSMVVQGMIAAIAAGAVALKLYWKRLKSVFGRKPAAGAEEKQEE